MTGLTIANETLQWLLIAFLAALTIGLARKGPNSNVSSGQYPPIPDALQPGVKLEEVGLVSSSENRTLSQVYEEQEFGILFVSSTCPACQPFLEQIDSLGESKPLAVVPIGGEESFSQLKQKYPSLNYFVDEIQDRSKPPYGVMATPMFATVRSDFVVGSSSIPSSDFGEWPDWVASLVSNEPLRRVAVEISPTG